jgi:hypothetical protein
MVGCGRYLFLQHNQNLGKFNQHPLGIKNEQCGSGYLLPDEITKQQVGQKF